MNRAVQQGSVDDQPKRTAKDYLYLAFTGMCMGAADVVPGVSGGTMAFIMGVYQELVDAIKSFDLVLVRKAIRLDFRGVLDHIPWRFLVALLTGLVCAVLGLAHVVTWLLDNEKVLLYAFFFGLVLASVVAIGVTVRWSIKGFASLLAGAVLAYWIVGLVPVETPKDPVTIFFSACIAISAMILPGISGSFILLILGQYAYVLAAVKALDVGVLIPFLAGCAIGIMAFARLLSWLFAHYEQLTLTLLIGFMLGSLRKIWPFKETVATRLDRHGELVPLAERNLLPDFGSLEALYAAGLAALGFALVLGLDRLQRRLQAGRSATFGGQI